MSGAAHTQVRPVDVLVVGLGPAGGSAATFAAAAGLNVLGIDSKETIGEPVQCAGFVPMQLAHHAQHPHVFRQRVSRMRTALPSGAAEFSDVPGLMVDRAAFDQYLAERAKIVGARVRTGVRLAALNTSEKIATLSGAQGERQVHYSVLVAADGPRSSIAMLMGLAALRTINTRQYTVPLKFPHEDTDIWLNGDYPGGYGWMFPSGELANVGVAVEPEFNTNIKERLDALHAHLVALRMVGGEIFRRSGGAIPVGGLRERLVHGQILFVGDAAGLTHPITGAGVSAAVVSGERAGQVAAEYLAGDVTALAGYEEDMR
ncbi:MAG: NAD(P)/FAD-dependent oxidoreductase, partial [Pseudomonadota bacterium]